MSAAKKGLKVSLHRHRGRFFPNQEEKELAMRPYFPGTFHSTDAVRRHTLSHGSKKGQTPSQIGFSHRRWRKPTLAIGDRFLHKVLGPTKPSSTNSPNTSELSPVVLFPQFQSCFISPQDVVLANWIIEVLSPVFGRLHFPENFRFLPFI